MIYIRVWYILYKLYNYNSKKNITVIYKWLLCHNKCYKFHDIDKDKNYQWRNLYKKLLVLEYVKYIKKKKSKVNSVFLVAIIIQMKKVKTIYITQLFFLILSLFFIV